MEWSMTHAVSTETGTVTNCSCVINCSNVRGVFQANVWLLGGILPKFDYEGKRLHYIQSCDAFVMAPHAFDSVKFSRKVRVLHRNELVVMFQFLA